MSFDSSRFTFNPWNDFSGVVMQQGRVQLDSEWNEWLAELARRIQAGSYDTLGQAVYPATTPNAFQIAPNAAGTSITIGAGRMYVDGLLVENHGLTAPAFQGWVPTSTTSPAGTNATWDPALAELFFSSPVDYASQPYYPNVSVVAPFPTSGGPYLIYLDVWQRELTFLEDPDLIEKAVGIDTTGRLQTVWQVKWLDVSQVNKGNVSCSTSNADLNWPPPLSAGRLTTGVVQSTPSGPCCLTPNTGYTGLENQLYRVEIHQLASGSTPTTFKWSRDDASIATAITAISPDNTVLTVQSTGKDNVLHFAVNDWVEITDDWLELNGQAGELHQVKDVDNTARTITLTSAVTGSFNPSDPTRHTRAVRWNGANINVPAPGTTVTLEDGITVAFDLIPNTGSLNLGDFWTFAARTVDGTVESLVDAPPRGVHHHYARLAVLTFPLSSSNPPSDCRVPWPHTGTGAGTNCGCCTVTVQPTDISATNTLQSIIDQFANQNEVTICLMPGSYALPVPLVLTRQHSNLTLEGCHRGVFLMAAAGAESNFVDGLVVISQASWVTLRDLIFVLPIVPFVKAGGQLATQPPGAFVPAGGPTAATLSRLDVSIGVRPIDALHLTIEDCGFTFPDLTPANADANSFAVGIFGGSLSEFLTLQRNSFIKGPGDPMQISAEPFRLSIGYLLAPGSSIKQIHASEAVAEFVGNVVQPTAILNCSIHDNEFFGLTAAVLIYGQAGQVNVDANSADSCYSGLWILGRRTQPDPTIGPTNTDKQQLLDVLLDPVLALASAIARSYPLPKASKITGKVVNGKVQLINPNPLKNNPLLARFYVLAQIEAAMEAAAVGTALSSLALHCANNRLDALLTPGLGGDSGEALVVWGEDGDFESSLVLNANKLRNNATPTLSTVVIASMSRCSINGNILLNTCPTTPGVCLYVILTTGQSGLSAGMAVTGNVLQTGTNIPANWVPMNVEV